MSLHATRTIQVRGDAPYEVSIGHGGLAERVAPGVESASKVLIVHAPPMAAQADALREALGADGRQVLIAEIPDAEGAKRIEVASFLWGIMGQSDFTRGDAIVGLGGGATTDVAGFVAATWLRGIRAVVVPTTVLGLVDAAVGGKTGINTAEGKNLVGAFHHPAAVVVDLSTLETLSRNELLTGFAEVAKCGFLGAPNILEPLRERPELVTDPTSVEFVDAVESAIAFKADVVSNDFREAGQREILNYGHTLGHAIEHQERYRWRHGAAISIGMMYAAELARLAGRLDDDAVELHREVLGNLELPLTYPGGRWPGLVSIMKRDKKARGAMMRFIVLDGIGKPAVMQAPDESLLFAAYQEISA